MSDTVAVTVPVLLGENEGDAVGDGEPLALTEGDVEIDGDTPRLLCPMARSRLQALSTKSRVPLFAVGNGGANARPLAVNTAFVPMPSAAGEPDDDVPA